MARVQPLALLVAAAALLVAPATAALSSAKGPCPTFARSDIVRALRHALAACCMPRTARASRAPCCACAPQHDAASMMRAAGDAC
jgi:hypothetical protein